MASEAEPAFNQNCDGRPITDDRLSASVDGSKDEASTKEKKSRSGNMVFIGCCYLSQWGVLALLVILVVMFFILLGFTISIFTTWNKQMRGTSAAAQSNTLQPHTIFPSQAPPTMASTDAPGQTEQIFTNTNIGSKFTIAVYPDLQKLTKDKEEAVGLDTSTDAILERRNDFNIKMALAVGDMVNVATTCEHQSRWDRVLRNVHRLDQAGIPFIPTCGNHDGCQPEYGQPSDYNKQFTADYSCDRDPYVVADKNPFYRGEFSANSDTGFENSWYTFEHDGVKFILLSLRYGRNNELHDEWNTHTDQILEQHQDHYGIILTHEAHDAHREHVCNNPNVKLIIQGHRHGGRKREHMDCGGGHTIQRFIFAFRHDREMWIQEASASRYFTFLLDEGRVEMRTYSSHEGRYLDDQSACDSDEGVHCDVFSWYTDFRSWF